MRIISDKYFHVLFRFCCCVCRMSVRKIKNSFEAPFLMLFTDSNIRLRRLIVDHSVEIITKLFTLVQ